MKIAIKMDLKDREEVFTHRDDDGIFRHFPTGFMNRMAKEYGGLCDQIMAIDMPIEPYVAEHIRAKMGIEQPRLDRMASPYLEMPIIGILWPGNERLTIVDGNHRYIKLFEAGEKRIKCYAFRHPFWEELLIPLTDDEKRLTAYSGVIEAEEERAAKESLTHQPRKETTNG